VALWPLSFGERRLDPSSWWRDWYSAEERGAVRLRQFTSETDHIRWFLVSNCDGIRSSCLSLTCCSESGGFYSCHNDMQKDPSSWQTRMNRSRSFSQATRKAGDVVTVPAASLGLGRSRGHKMRPQNLSRHFVAGVDRVLLEEGRQAGFSWPCHMSFGERLFYNCREEGKKRSLGEGDGEEVGCPFQRARDARGRAKLLPYL
jgi:hypothetical protein